MGNATKIGKVMVKTGEYQSQGTTKGRYAKVGMLMQGENGFFLIMDRTFNPAGVPNPDNSDTFFASVFTDDKNQGNQGGYGSGGGYPQGGGYPSGGGYPPNNGYPAGGYPPNSPPPAAPPPTYPQNRPAGAPQGNFPGGAGGPGVPGNNPPRFDDDIPF